MRVDDWELFVRLFVDVVGGPVGGTLLVGTGVGVVDWQFLKIFEDVI